MPPVEILTSLGPNALIGLALWFIFTSGKEALQLVHELKGELVAIREQLARIQTEP